jgi:NAD(P)-dependent dehydrogenase (short-subunit alcohol dehydrogenase family)
MPEPNAERSAFRLDGETALITGGGTGLGFGIAQALMAAGAHVVITGRRENVLAKAVERLGPGARWAVHDVTHMATDPGLVEQLRSEGVDISILVNNAGVHLKKPAVETEAEEFRNVMDTHVHGAFALIRAVLPGMIERKHGSILFIASMASFLGIPQVIAYSAAKSAYLGMIRSLASEVGPMGVRTNGIAPGWIETPMLHQALDGDPERKRKILSRTPMARFGAPTDIGMAAVYLCSPAANFVNGVVLPVDGGACIGF